MKRVICLKSSSGKPWGDDMIIKNEDLIWNKVTVEFSGSDRELLKFLHDFFYETAENAYKCNNNDVLIMNTDIFKYKRSVYKLCELLDVIGE